jgi:hypothetical protein
MQPSCTDHFQKIINALRKLFEKDRIDLLGHNRRTGRAQEKIAPFDENAGIRVEHARREMGIDGNLKRLPKLRVVSLEAEEYLKSSMRMPVR